MAEEEVGPIGSSSSKVANEKILALVPAESVKRIPFFVRRHALSKTFEKIEHEHPDLYAAAAREGELPEDVREQLSQIVNGIFEQKLRKHNL
ncbi:MAG: hypothetical protein PUF11_03485 [Parafannyhessea umbonata]|jgi:hypothetical protein|uniref:hypothetical protein n=1 Tax=Parafannyhessea umbonata TaxID=604330 RepID=UPI0026EF451A|nr:hypothetical protein [Parafannyhessea umbonata]MDD6565832.1 hypothetical protein [Parafannyhessea umbonata]